MRIKKTGLLILVILFSLFLPFSSCKKTPTTPDTEDFTRPIIWLNLTNLAFTATKTGSNPPPQILQVKNSGQNPLNYTISDDVEWLEISPTEGSSQGEIIEHQVTIDKSQLSPQDQDYTATITVSCSEAYNNPQTVDISLTLTKNPPPEIQFSPATLTFSAKKGGTNPPSQNLYVENCGQGTLDYKLTSDVSWLKISPKDGESKKKSNTHKISVKIGNLNAGNYTGQITINDPEACNNPQSMTVSLQVSNKLPARIWLNPTSFSFSAQKGGTNPPIQSLRIKNTGEQALDYTISDDASWLSVSPANGRSTGGEQVHAVSIDISGLNEGIYTGTISVADPDASNSPQTVNVSLTITKKPPPQIWISHDSLSFSATEGGSNPSSQSIKIKNTGQQTLNYSISDDADWLSVNPTSGSSTGGENSHSVSANVSGLGEGSYSGTITISDANASNSPQTVSVILTISKQPPPQIWVSHDSLSFSATEGGSNPSSQNIKIRNSGEQTLNYSISDDADWLSVNPTSGSSTGGENSHSVSADISGLGEGSYSGTITISDVNASNSPQTVGVTLTISKQPPPQIWVSHSSLSFSTTEGGSNPSSQTLKIKNSGQQTLNYTISDDAGWLSINPTSGSSTGGENSHSVSADISGLSTGTYSGSITITDTNAGNSPQTVSVTLKVKAPLGDNEIGISCSPSSAGTDTIIDVPISISGNNSQITFFGLKMTFDASVFQYVSVSKGSLTGSWATVDGNESSGIITIGGFAGSGNPIPKDSSGTIAIVKLKVTCSSCSDGQQSQISINNYTDDIAGMTPEPANATFSYKK